MGPRTIVLAVAIGLCQLAFTAGSQPFDKLIEGKVVSVTDGDTITVLDASKQQYKIRLEGIDAPESRQAYGTQAKKALAGLVFGKEVRVQWREKDRYGRTLGHIYVGEQWINLAMVERGMAWHYKKYSSDKQLAAAESAARAKQIGLWSDKAVVAPWDFRKGLGSNSGVGESPATPLRLAPTHEASETVFVTKTGTKYHRDGCRSLSKSRIAMPLREATSRYTPLLRLQAISAEGRFRKHA